MKCFSCGETGHHQANYKKQGKKALFVDPDDYEEKDTYVGEQPMFDGTDEGNEKVLEGDTGPALVVIQICLTPRANRDEWLRNNIFQSTCTIQGKVCRFVIDAGSCENIVSIEAMQKLGVKTETHPKPYKLAWLKKGGKVIASQRALISFSIRSKYKDQVWCDVVIMNACHVLLGRPWQYDCRVTYNGHTNTYNFYFNNTKIVLLPSRMFGKLKPTEDSNNLLSLMIFEMR